MATTRGDLLSSVISDGTAITLEFPAAHEQVLASGLVGAVVFPTVLGLAQVALHKPLRLTSSSSLSSLAGGATVFAACLAASYTTVHFYAVSRALLPSRQPESTPSTAVGLSHRDLLLSTAGGVVFFKAFGGKFSSVLPSNILRPGSFARHPIPVNTASYASSGQKKFMQEIGRRHGCHTCGRKRVDKFVADHQPPSKLVQDSNVVQAYYPQCSNCSSLQGVAVNKGKLVHVVTHPFALRAYHLFLPIPLGLALFKRSVQQKHGAVLLEAIAAPSQSGTQESEGNTSVAHEQQQRRTPQDKTSSDPSADVSKPLSDFSANFPLLIVWQRVLNFLDSLHPCGRFHMTIWAFSIIAALGCL